MSEFAGRLMNRIEKLEGERDALRAENERWEAVCRQSQDQTMEVLARNVALRSEVEAQRHGWQRECEDTDSLIQGLGLCPSEYRSEGGSLLLGRIRHKVGNVMLDNERLRAEVEALRFQLEQKEAGWQRTYDHDVAKLRAEVEALRKDAERYRWLRAGRYPLRVAQQILNDTPEGIDAAIDAALNSADKPCQHEWLQSQYNFTCGKCGTIQSTQVPSSG